MQEKEKTTTTEKTSTPVEPKSEPREKDGTPGQAEPKSDK